MPQEKYKSPATNDLDVQKEIAEALRALVEEVREIKTFLQMEGRAIIKEVQHPRSR